MNKKKTLDQQLIRSILGKDKFLMLNLDMIKKLGLNEALLLTYLLDKFEFYVSINDMVLDKGMIFYRTDIEEKICLSPYNQRKAEKKLTELNLISVETKFDKLMTFNIYQLNIDNIVEVLVNTPSKILGGG